MPTLVSIAVTPNVASIIGPATKQLAAIGTYSDNSTADVTSTATWSTSNSKITVDVGLVTGSQFGGSALITAAIGDVAGTCSVGVKKTQTKLKALLKILLTPLQDFENAAQQVITITVTSATGETLTELGKFVGQPRNGISDDDVFRRYVQAKIAANRSRSTGNDIINVMKLVLGDANAIVIANNIGDAGFEITIKGVIVTPDIETVLLYFLRIAQQDGVRGVIYTMAQLESDTFSWDTDPSGGGGWGDDDNASVGSPWCSSYS